MGVRVAVSVPVAVSVAVVVREPVGLAVGVLLHRRGRQPTSGGRGWPMTNPKSRCTHTAYIIRTALAA